MSRFWLAAVALTCALIFPSFADGQVPVTLAPVARQQFFYASGVPIAGGKLCTFAAGTTTPQATYTDASGTIQNSDPIILDGAGSASIWLAGLSYKFVLLSPGTDSSCSTGTQQWMADNVSDVGYLNSLNAVLLTGNQTVAGNKVFTGNVTVQGIAAFNGSATFPSLNNIVYVGGTLYPPTAAGINAAVTSTFGAPIEVVINYPGSYCDAVVNPTNLSLLQFGPGVYIINIAGVDSTTTNVTWAVVGAGRSQTTLQSCPGSNKDVITSQNFGSFTGGSNFYGVYQPNISALTIDGNKSTESQGFGVRLYGRSVLPSNVLIQNNFQDGIWAEWGGTESDTGPGTGVNGAAIALESDYNGGNGFSFKGNSAGAINAVNVLIAHNNGGWGFQMANSVSIAQINSYENVSGGCDVQPTSGGLIAALATCNANNSIGGGWGLLQEAGAGVIDISGGEFAGGIPLELRSTGGGTIKALVELPTAGSPCVKINGGGAFVMDLEMSGCATDMFAFISEPIVNAITAVSTGSAPLYSGTPNTGDSVNLTAAATHYSQFPTGTVSVAGWTPTFPTTNGNILATGNTDAHFQYKEVAGCSTPGTTGSPCASAITVTWTTAFADTSYDVYCTGGGIASGSPGAVYWITKATTNVTINYAAMTNSAAAYTNVDCTAIHN